MSANAVEMSHRDTATNGKRQARNGPMDRVYFLLVWSLMVAGIVFVFSASFPTAGRPDALLMPGDPYHYLLKHAKYVGVALVAMLLTCLIDTRYVRRAAPWVFGGGV